MAEEITLFWGYGSAPCWRVMIALEEKELQGYNKKRFLFANKEHKSKEVIDVNPRGQGQFKSQGTKLIPVDPDELALMYQRMMEGLVLNQKSADLIYYDRRVPEEERQDRTLKGYSEILTAELKLWEGYLEKTPGPFLAGNTFSLADVTVYPNVSCLFQFGLKREKYPNLAAYFDSLKERPSISDTWPPNWSKNPEGRDLLKDI